MAEIIAAAHPGNTAGIKATTPVKECRADKCETRINIGVFFDGTGNNQDWVENGSVNWRMGIRNWWQGRKPNTKTQLQQRADSNVARLFRSYPDNPQEGYFRMYVPGLGTPFPEIGEIEPSGLGAGFGSGGDGRINFGMLHVLNSMYAAISVGNKNLIMPTTIKALCSLGHVGGTRGGRGAGLSESDAKTLRPVDMANKGGLLMSADHSGNRKAFFQAQFDKLGVKIANTPKPQLVEVFIDVFGFSRGAAQARTFCNWMDQLFSGSRLAGVTTHIRFVGLFDTVAAVGLGPTATPFTDGHQSWGDATYLKIPARVGHCEHYAAMHENRGAFSLEDVYQAGSLPANCRQYRCPGMHSDVGGGYSPLDQGRPPGQKDSEKLSQIPLNDMFAAAVAAKVPLDKDLAVSSGGWDCYEIAPRLLQASQAFLDANGRGPRAFKDCLMDYLAWRISVRGRFAKLAGTARASADDREDLIGANQTLIDDYNAVEAVTTRKNTSNQQIKRLADLSKDAKEIVQRAKTYRAFGAAEEDMFANFCHDSYAGFKPFDAPVAVGVDMPGTWETEGYLRYRTRYEGNDTRLTMNDKPHLQQAHAVV
jgi:Uncharacterized alpha/beta hydrolase domain (DUF2235)